MTDITTGVKDKMNSLERQYGVWDRNQLDKMGHSINGMGRWFKLLEAAMVK